MTMLSRRNFLISSAAFAAGTVFAQQPQGGTAGPMPMRRRPVPRSVGDSASMQLEPGISLPAAKVQIAGKTYIFGIDTAAMGFGRVSPALASAARLAEAGNMMVSDPTGQHAKQVGIFRIPTMQLGGVRFLNVDAEEESMLPQGCDGLLGAEIFAGFVVGLDAKGAQLTLRRGRLSGTSDSRTFSTPTGPALRVPVHVGPLAFDADVDTGQCICGLLVSAGQAAQLQLHAGPQTHIAHTVGGAHELNLAQNTVPVTAGSATLYVEQIGWPSPTPFANLGWKAFSAQPMEFDIQQRLCRLA